MLNEFVYCPRLFYYEFVESVFVESVDTVRGKALHRRVDSGKGDLPPAGQQRSGVRGQKSGVRGQRTEDGGRRTEDRGRRAEGGAKELGAGSQGASAAWIPFGYISDARQRIEIYRKLAQANEAVALRNLETELRDRFGPLPPPLELLLQAAELRIVAGDRGITVIEVKDDKLMLTRNSDLIMLGTRFPRLTKKQAGARLKEIKKLLLAL